jgi:hypothetical protein
MLGREFNVFVSFLVIALAVTFGYLLARKLAPRLGVA